MSLLGERFTKPGRVMAGGLVILATGSLLVGDSLFFYTKGWLAQQLLERAWKITLDRGEAVRAWSWADTTPLGKLIIPHLDYHRVVLNAGGTEALAFGPAHVAGTARPGEIGNVVLAGHRDSYFRQLAKLEVGDSLFLESMSGKQKFIVSFHVVANPTDIHYLDKEGPNRLTMITCYPFDYIGSAPQRYIVIAYPVERDTMNLTGK